MKLVLHTLMIFFGTLAAAALVALGEPSEPEFSLSLPVHSAPVASTSR